MLPQAMAERQLSIIFGCLATVLAIASIILAYVQHRTHSRQPRQNTTPSALENGGSPAVTASDEPEDTSGRQDGLIMLLFVVHMNSAWML